MRLLPSEVKSNFVIPVIRREMSKKMDEKGLKQIEIAKELGITQSAVSQYLKGKRAIINIDLTSEIEKEIEKAVENISSSNDDLAAPIEIRRICRFMEDKGVVCDIHKKQDNVPEDCNFCEE